MTKPSKLQAGPAAEDVLRRHVRILTDLAHVGSTGGRPESTLDHMVLQVARAVEIDHVKILRYRPESADFLMVAGIGWKPGLVGSAVFSGDYRTSIGRTFHTAEPLVIEDLDETDLILSEMLRDHGIVSLANVPVLIDGAAWGVLEVDSTVPRGFGTDTTAFLTAAAAVLSVILAQQGSQRSAAEARAEVAQRAQARETLLREMQHRVKNNFQLILSSVMMLRRRWTDPGFRGALGSLADRIQAISIAHDQLAVRNGGEAVGLATYLRAICATLQHHAEAVSVETDLDEMEIAVDRAVALGLILNEAATNSIKYAFGEGPGRLTVSLRRAVGPGEARLTIADDGRGIAEDATEGSGVLLMRSLARQIGGTLERDTGTAGTTVSVSFVAAP